MSDEPEATDRRETDRRQGERRHVPWWQTNWKGVVGILAGIAALLSPVLDYMQRSAAMQYQFQIDLRRAEIEAQHKRDPAEKQP